MENVLSNLLSAPLEGPAVPDPLSSTEAARHFLQSYWQRHPAVIRGTDILADNDLGRALKPSALRGMAARETVESRLVVRRGDRYRLEHGPLPAEQLPSAGARQWTLLVQGVDLHLAPVAALRARFRFVADVRLDDVMVSLAADGGGVGPHVDAYDVFLIQIEGTRRWQLAPPGPVRLRPDQPLRLLEGFEPTITCELQAGDMLYLPPGWAHDGVGIGTCVTASVGFRAPTVRELQTSWLQDQVDLLMDAEQAGEADTAYEDALTASEISQWEQQPAALSDGLVANLIASIEQWRPGRDEMIDFIGRMLTELKPGTYFDAPGARALTRLIKSWPTAGIALDRRTRMAYRGKSVFVNGDSFDADGRTLELLKRLADERRLEPGGALELLEDPDASAGLQDWAALGWLAEHREA